MRVALVGLPGLDEPLRSELPYATIVAIPDADATTLEEGLRGVDVAVVDAGAAGRLRTPPPAIACVARSTPETELRALTARGVARLLFLPVTAAELAVEIRRLAPPPPAENAGGASATEAARERAGAAMAELWLRFRGTMAERLDVLERAAAALLEGDPAPAVLDEARAAAHKLRGALGTFGRPHGSRLAAEIETLFEAGPPDGAAVYRYAELVLELRQEVERPDAPGGGEAPNAEDGSPRAPADGAPRVLILDGDPGAGAAVAAAGLAAGWETMVAGSLAELEPALHPTPALVILDPAAIDSERLNSLLRRLALDGPRVPVVFHVREPDLRARVDAAQRGVRAVVPKRSDPGTLIARAARVLEEGRRPRGTLLVVDDDPVLLEFVRGALTSSRVRVVTLQDPLRFWETLEETRPDMVLLDVDMPHVNGIQLCRVIRGTPEWPDLPVLFLTAHTDPETVARAFRAGADDFVAKPVIGPELRARVEGCLDRVRRRGTTVMGDPFGPGRAAVLQRAATLLALARRHRERVAVGLLDARTRPGAGGLSPSALLRRLGEAARDEDVVVPWSPGEIALLLYGMDRDEARRWLVDRTSGPGGPGAGAPAGFSLFPDDGTELDDLVEVAAARMAVAREPAAVGSPSSPAGPAWRADVDVVVVEDDDALAELVEESLAGRGLTVRRIRDGVQALRLLGGEHPSLRPRAIILDVGLPGMDGLSVLRRLVDDGTARRTPVVMLTARAAEAEVLHALELGAFDHVAKPFSVNELLHRVRRAMDAGAAPPRPSG